PRCERYKSQTHDDHNEKCAHDLAVVEILFHHYVSISTLPLGGRCLPILRPMTVSQMPVLLPARRWLYLRRNNEVRITRHANYPHAQAIVSRLCRCPKNCEAPRVFHKPVAYMSDCNTSLACLYPGLRWIYHTSGRTLPRFYHRTYVSLSLP